MTDTTLRQQRCLFTALIAKLITECNVYRSYELALAPTREHMPNSLHYIGLAQDIDLYIDGVYQKDSAAHQWIGARWKSMHPLCRWGGDFAKPDGNHYSMEWQGVK
jgi:hypothetical protein